MKRPIALVTLVFLMEVYAGKLLLAADLNDYLAVERGPHHRVWARIGLVTNQLGQVHLRTNSFTELASGLHVWTGNNWVEANPRIIVTNNGAIGYGAQHVVAFGANLNRRGAIQIRTPEGVWLKSHVLGLAYHDRNLRTNVLIAQVKDSFGQLVGSNQVVYADAFQGVQADVQYRYRKAGIEQDIILRQRPPLPQQFGLDPSSTHLLAITEFVESPAPQVEDESVPVGSETMTDQTVAFGSLRTVAGRAFSIGNRARRWEGAPVYKTWENWQGRTLLIERVRFQRVRDELLELPVTTATNGPTAAVSGTSTKWFASGTVPVEEKLAESEARPLRQMVALSERSGFVVDYDLVYSSSWGWDFYCDSTYLINDECHITGSSYFEPGAILKFDNNGTLYVDGTFYYDGDWDCNGFTKVVMTSASDDSIGEWVPRGSCNPCQCWSGPAVVVRPQYFATAQAAFVANTGFGCLSVVAGSPYVTVTSTDIVATKSTMDKATFKISREAGDWTQPMTVNFAVSGTAVAGVDYVSIGTSATIAPGQGYVTVEVTPAAQGGSVYDSTVTLTLQAGSGYMIGSPAVTNVTIYDPSVPAPPGVLALPELVGWWRAENNANDSKGANNGVLLYGVGFTYGKVAQGFSFDGVDDRVVITPVDSKLDFGAGVDFSIEAWIRPETATTAYGVQTIVDKRDTANASTATGYAFFLTYGKLSCQLAVNGAYANFAMSSPNLRDGAWHHVAVTVDRDSATGLKFYVDGALVGTFNPTSRQGSLINTKEFRIGNHAQSGLNAHMKGVIDEVSVYNRVLTGPEVQSIFGAGRGGKYFDSDSDGLSDFWEQQYFGGLGQGANDDFDCDGLTNLQEFQGPSNPANAPVIQVQPQNQDVCEGGSATFSVTPTGGNLSCYSFQWKFGETSIPGATSSSYTRNNLGMTDIGGYKVVVTSAGGTTTSSAAQLAVRHCNPVSFPNFTDSSLLQFNGSASPFEAALQLTPSQEALPGLAGSAFLKSRMSLQNNASFSTFFAFRLKSPGGQLDADCEQGADGVTFTLQANSAQALGGVGGDLGYLGANRINNSVTIEFDTWYNHDNPPGRPTPDPTLPDGQVNCPGSTPPTNNNHLYGDGNHIAIAKNGEYLAQAYTHVNTPMNNGAIWYAWIDYDGVAKRLQVRLHSSNNRPTNPTLQLNAFEALNFLTTPDVYAGFTAATAGAYNRQEILLWEMRPNYNPVVTGPPQLVVNAGLDKTTIRCVPDPIDVNLADSSASASNGETPTYAWTVKSAPAGANVNWQGQADTLHPSPRFTQAGIYVLEFKATFASGEKKDFVTINILDNQKPIVSAGPDRQIVFGQAAQLDGSITDDALANLEIEWVAGAGNPAGQVEVVRNPACPGNTPSDKAKFLALFGLGANEVAGGAQYDGSGEYSLAGLTTGSRYYYTRDSSGGSLINGGETITQSGFFTAASSRKLTGTASATVTAKIQPETLTAANAGVYRFILTVNDGTCNSVQKEMGVTLNDVDGQSRTFTRNVDFAEGNLVNLNYDKHADQLEINDQPAPFHFINVACSGRGTIVRIDADTGRIVGEYQTAPSGLNYSDNATKANPSRTTVDRYGNVWVANRGDIELSTGYYTGSVMRVGIVVGGTRCDADKTSNPEGQYLKPPFLYNTCIDRHGAGVGTPPDGLIKTSRRLGDILAWTGLTVDGAEDEAIINFTYVVSHGTRTLAVDATNNVWVGGTGDSRSGKAGWHELLSGKTGLPIPYTSFSTADASGGAGGGYGGLIDRHGVLWTSRGQAVNGLIRFDPILRFPDYPELPTSDLDVDDSYSGEKITENYGVAIDPRTGNLWVSERQNIVREVVTAPVLADVQLGRSYAAVPPQVSLEAQGIVVGADGDIWLAQGVDGPGGIAHLYAPVPDAADNSVKYVGKVTYPCVGQITGVTVDHRGRIWGTDIAKDLVVRVDPNRGEWNTTVGRRIGEVDLTVPLGSGAGPYNYSDMSGFVTLGATLPSGMWNVVYEGNTSEVWKKVVWTRAEQPHDGTVVVEVRADDDPSKVSGKQFVPVTSDDAGTTVPEGKRFTGTLPTSPDTISGKFIELRLTLIRSGAPHNLSPIIKDVTISSSATPVVSENAASFARDDSKIIQRNSSKDSINNVIDVLANDIGTGLTIAGWSPATRGWVDWKSDADHTKLRYTPNAGEFGEDSFIYSVADGKGGIERATVKILITSASPSAPPPVARDDVATVQQDSHDNKFLVTQNDSTTEPELALIEISQPTHGTARKECNEIYYTPDEGFSGEDRVLYKVQDQGGQSATAWLIINVLPRPVLPCDRAIGGVVTKNSPRVQRTGVPPGNGQYFANLYQITGSGQTVTIDSLSGDPYISLLLRKSNGDLVTADFGVVDSQLTPAIAGTVTCSVWQHPAKILVGGVVDGTTPAYFITRIDSQTSHLDGSFTPPTFDGDVNSLVVVEGETPNEKIFVGGNFTGRLKKLYPNGQEEGIGGSGLDGSILCMAVQDVGGTKKLLVGGAFSGHLKRLNLDGTVDSTFDQRPTLNGNVTSILVKPYDGGIIIGGEFTEKVMQLEVADGLPDSNFSPPSLAENVTCLALADQRILIGGGTSTSGFLVRLLADGQADGSFTAPTFDKRVNCVAYQGARILAGGDFATVDTIARGRLARFYADGGLDTYFDRDARITTGTATVRCFADSGGAEYLVGGNFDSLGGVPRLGLAQLHAPQGYDMPSITATLVSGQNYVLEVAGNDQYVPNTDPPEIPEDLSYYLLVKCSTPAPLLVVSLAPGVGAPLIPLPTGSTLDVGAGQDLDVPSVVLANEGTAPLIIQRPSFAANENEFSLDQTLPLDFWPQTIAPGSSIQFSIYPPATTGEHSDTMTLCSVAGCVTPIYRLELVGRLNDRGNPGSPTFTLVPPDGFVLTLPPGQTTGVLPLLADNVTASAGSTIESVTFYGDNGDGQGLVKLHHSPPENPNPDTTPSTGSRYRYQWDGISLNARAIAAVAKDTEDRYTMIKANISVRQDGDNRPPVAANDYKTVGMNSSNNKITGVLANDTDPDGDSLTVLTFTEADNGHVVREGNTFSYTPPPGAFGADKFTYTIHDGRGGTATAKVYITVSDTSPPVVGLTADHVEVPWPWESTAVGLVADPTPRAGGSITKVEFYANGRLLHEDSSSPYGYSWTTFSGGPQLIQAVAYDDEGTKGYSDVVTINVARKPGNTPPVAVISSPSDQVEMDGTVRPALVREGFCSIVGSVSDPNGDNTRYRFFVYNTEQKLVLTTDWVAGPKASTELTSLDFSSLPNGIYDLELVAQDGEGTGDSFRAYDESRAELRIALNSELKIGRVAFSQEDLGVSIGGIPFSIVRTYDSWNPKKGDFGYSWTFEASLDMDVELDEFRRDVPDELEADGTTFSLRAGGGRDVTLTLPDGRRTTFRYRLAGPSFYDWGVDQYRAVWDAEPGVSARLTTLNPGESGNEDHAGTAGDNSLLISYLAVGGGTEQWGVGTVPATPVENYDFPGFKLKTEDGTVYEITRGTGEEHAMFSEEWTEMYPVTYGKPKLTRITELDGTVIEIADDKITKIAPTGQKMSAIVFQRDGDGRITGVFGPASLDGETITGPASVKYDYDTAGNLYRVHRLTQRDTSTASPPNHIYETMTYVYGDTRPGLEHMITKLDNSRGQSPMRQNSYDSQGRLTGFTDAKGHTTTFTHKLLNPLDTDDAEILALAPTAKILEKNTDYLNHVDSEAKDARGNVVVKIDTLNRMVVSQYDERNQIVQEDQRAADANNTLICRSITEYTYGFSSKPEQASQITVRKAKVEGGVVVSGADQITTTVFDSNGQFLYSVDPKGLYTKNTYLDDDSDAPGELEKTELCLINATPELTDDEVLQRLVLNVYYDETDDGGKFRGLLKSTKDALDNITLYSYYDGSPESGGTWGQKKQEKQLDASGNVLSLVEYVYDAEGNVVLEKRARNNDTDFMVTEREYDDAGRVVLERDPEGGETRTVYDASDLVASTTDAYNNTTSYLYDDTGEVIQTTHPDNSIVRTATIYDYEFDTVNHRIGRAVITEEPHLEGVPATGTRTVFDEADQEIRVETLANFSITIEPDGAAYQAVFNGQTATILTTTYNDYDELGRLRSFTDARGNVTVYGYDGYGRRNCTKVWVTTPTGVSRQETTMTLDDHGNALTATIVVTPVDNATDDEPTGSPVTVNTPTYSYDGLNRKWLTTFQDGTYARNIFDGLGRVVESIDQEGVSTKNEYDGAGRLVKVFKSYQLYDPTDLNDYASPNVLDANPADRTETRYVYNLAGQLIKQIDANQTPLVTPASTDFTYDKLGRRLSRTLPGGGPGSVESWKYDGNVTGGTKPQKVEHTDFNGTKIRDEFDEMGRLWKHTPVSSPRIALAGMSPVTFTYTAGGQRSTMTDASGVTEYQYDSRNRLWKKTVEKDTANARMLTYTYNNNDAVEGIVSSSGTTSLTYQYDELNRLKSVNGASYGYDAAGNLETTTYYKPDTTVAATTTYHYSTVNRLRYMTVKDGAASTLASFDYDDYNSTGWSAQRRLARTGQRRGAAEMLNHNGTSYRRVIAYDFDNLKRLRADRVRTATGTWPTWPDVVVPGTPTSGDVLYGYDKVGNRLSRQSALSGVANYTDHTFDAKDRLFSGSFTYAYDDNGNTLRGEVNPGTTTAIDQTADDEYDSENRLIIRKQASPLYAGGKRWIEVLYDGDGQRVRKTIKDWQSGRDPAVQAVYDTPNAASTIRYLVDDRNPTGFAQVLEEWEAAGSATPTLRRAYTYGHDLVSQKQPDNSVQYFGHDGHGNVRLLLTSGGVVTDTYSYDAFGILIDETHTTGNGTPNSYLYCGEQWDDDLGMYFLRARYLNPASGRFWTMDSFEGSSSEPFSLHKYLYAHCDPVNGRDPSGQMTFVEALTVMAKQVGMAGWRTYNLWKKVDKAYRPWVLALVLANFSEAITSDVIPDEVVYLAMAYNTKLLVNFNRISKKSTTYRATSKMKNLYQWITGVAQGARKYGQGIGTSVAGFPVFQERHLSGGSSGWLSKLVPEDGLLHHMLSLRSQTFITYSGYREGDYSRANRNTLRLGLGRKPPRGTVWHHHECVGIMQLVQERYHVKYHKGGCLIYDILVDPKKPYNPSKEND